MRNLLRALNRPANVGDCVVWLLAAPLIAAALCRLILGA